MAIHCRAVKNSLRGTAADSQADMAAAKTEAIAAGHPADIDSAPALAIIAETTATAFAVSAPVAAVSVAVAVKTWDSIF